MSGAAIVSTGAKPAGARRVKATPRNGWLYAEGTRFWMLAALLGGAFLMGGGARPDITSLVLLRPLSFALAGLWRADAYPAPMAQLGHACVDRAGDGSAGSSAIVAVAARALDAAART